MTHQNPFFDIQLNSNQNFQNVVPDVPTLRGTITKRPNFMPNINEGSNKSQTTASKNNAIANFATYSDSKNCKDDSKFLLQPKHTQHFPCSIIVKMNTKDRDFFDNEMAILIGENFRASYCFIHEEHECCRIQFYDKRLYYVFIRRFSKFVHPLDEIYKFMKAEILQMKVIWSEQVIKNEVGVNIRHINVQYNKNIRMEKFWKYVSEFYRAENEARYKNSMLVFSGSSKPPKPLCLIDWTHASLRCEDNYEGQNYKIWRSKFEEFDHGFVQSYNRTVLGYDQRDANLGIRNYIDRQLFNVLNYPDNMKKRHSEKGVGLRPGLNYKVFNPDPNLIAPPKPVNQEPIWTAPEIEEKPKKNQVLNTQFKNFQPESRMTYNSNMDKLDFEIIKENDDSMSEYSSVKSGSIASVKGEEIIQKSTEALISNKIKEITTDFILKNPNYSANDKVENMKQQMGLDTNEEKFDDKIEFIKNLLIENSKNDGIISIEKVKENFTNIIENMLMRDQIENKTDGLNKIKNAEDYEEFDAILLEFVKMDLDLKFDLGMEVEIVAETTGNNAKDPDPERKVDNSGEKKDDQDKKKAEVLIQENFSQSPANNTRLRKRKSFSEGSNAKKPKKCNSQEN